MICHGSIEQSHYSTECQFALHIGNMFIKWELINGYFTIVLVLYDNTHQTNATLFRYIYAGQFNGMLRPVFKTHDTFQSRLINHVMIWYVHLNGQCIDLIRNVVCFDSLNSWMAWWFYNNKYYGIFTNHLAYENRN